MFQNIFPEQKKFGSHTFLCLSIERCLYSATSRSIQIRLGDNVGLVSQAYGKLYRCLRLEIRAADSISCLIGVGAPSDYKPPNGGFIYLQKKLNLFLFEFH